jgi:DNA-nicking Smr family endonuclease
MSHPTRRRGVPNREDLRLWVEVARTATPLPGKVLPSLDPEPAEQPPPRTHRAETAEPPRPAKGKNAKPTTAPTVQAASSFEPLERRLVRRLRRGVVAPAASIDLHGLTQDEALARLANFLRRCQAEGAKTAMVVTGKGGRAGPSGTPGVLRRNVPHWLASPALRMLVVGFEEAGAGLGGSGALIVRIRASRRKQRPGGA